MTSDEMSKNVDALENQQQEIEDTFSSMQQQLQFGGRITENDLFELAELYDLVIQLKKDIKHHSDSCQEEGDSSELVEEKERLDRLQRRNNLSATQIEQQYEVSSSSVKQRPSLLSRTGHFTFRVARKGLKKSWVIGKKTLNRVNPINRNVNYEDVSDHGIESLRLANSVYKTGKTTIQTTKTTIQTTKKSIKLAEDTGKTTYRTVKKTADMSYKVAKVIVVLTKNIVIGLATLATFPAFWIVVAVLVVLIVLILSIATLLGGAATIDEQNRSAANDPVALNENIPDDILDALEFFRIACENQKNEYTGTINGYYYDILDLRESDLVYMERNDPPVTFEKSLATNVRKEQLSAAWNVSLSEPEALAIVYVLLEHAENEANGTELQLYPIEYTQESFDVLLDACSVFVENIYAGQECPSKNCSVHYEEKPNPAFTTASNEYNTAVNRYNDFYFNVSPWSAEYRNRLEAYNAANNNARESMLGWVNEAYSCLEQAFRNWEYVYGYTGWNIDEYMDINCMAWLGGFVEDAQATMDNTPETISTPVYTCDHAHDLHSVGLNIYNANDTMTILGFSDEEKEWAENLNQTYAAYFASKEGG